MSDSATEPGDRVEVKVSDRRGQARETPSSEEGVDLQAQLLAAQKRINELAHAIQAGAQEREAFMERSRREQARLLDVERGAVAMALLEAIDELDLCLANADAHAPLTQGVRLIREGLVRKAGSAGVDPVALEGLPFDPNTAEAADMEVTGVPEEDGRVTRVYRPAWALGGRVIRPGRVKVARYVPPANA